MKVKTYTDDGYVESGLDTVVGGIDVLQIIEILYNKHLLSSDEVNDLLPLGFEVVDDRGFM